MNAAQVVKTAWDHQTIIPAFNIPHLPMAKAVIQAIIDEKAVAMVQVARLEWEKFCSKSLEAVAEEYFKYCDPTYTLLHLDHVPVIDEDHVRVDYMPILERAVKAGFQSCMVDGSRLPLEENIASVAGTVRSLYGKQEISCTISTRETLAAARLVADGWTSLEAMELTFLPLFEGTRTEGERGMIAKIFMTR